MIKAIKSVILPKKVKNIALINAEVVPVGRTDTGSNVKVN